ncbi:hypothetical protein [Clostridium ihumii]|uniref:hypothetical protein n=1 Tax=Clostridium ihumii TaxID=1470356 RepID=UPI000553D452|nr:hypothetical protein [Clostridium ihumii]
MPNYKDFDLDIQNSKLGVDSSRKVLPPTFSYEYDKLSECRCRPKTQTCATHCSCATYCNGSCNQHTDCAL